MMIIYAILIFCLLIFVHEFGHFITAKSVGIKVNEFALGMGPLLFHFKKGDTEYSLRALPIGGYCKMEGEDEDSDDESAFNNKPFLAKAFVIVAGSFMNLILAILIVAAIYISVGMPTTSIGELTPDLPAMNAGLLPGDQIVEVDQTTVDKWTDITTAIGETEKESIDVTVERDGALKTVSVDVVNSDDGRKIIGITPVLSKNPMRAVIVGTESTITMGADMVKVIGQLITREVSTSQLTGPVGIVHMVGDTAKMGLIYVAQLTALISLNLAVVNMLPFPALDGGRLLFLIIRLFTGKRISDDMEGKIHLVGMMLLFGLMIYITFQDIGRFF